MSNHDGSYIDSHLQIKNEKPAINPSNKKDNKYTITVVLNHKESKKDLQRIAKYKPFICNCNCDGINHPSKKEKIEKNWKK